MKPTWPNAAVDMRVPHDEVGSMVSQPSARELLGTELRVVKVATQGEGERTRVVAARGVQHRARKGADAAGRAEESGMARDPAERRGVVVVDLALKTPPSTQVVAHRQRRCRASPIIERQLERQQVRLQLDRDPGKQIGQRRAATIGGKKPQQDEPKIAVDGCGSRLARERHSTDLVLEFPSSRGRRVEKASRQSGRVLEQIAHRYTLAVGAAPFIEKRRHRLVEAHGACRWVEASRYCVTSNQIHHDARGRDDLGQRRQIEAGVDGRRRRRLVERQGSARLGPQRAAAITDLDRRRRKHPASRSRRLRLAARQRLTRLTIMPTLTQIAVPTATYQVQASGVKT